jgi:hypothetical protein
MLVEVRVLRATDASMNLLRAVDIITPHLPTALSSIDVVVL